MFDMDDVKTLIQALGGTTKVAVAIGSTRDAVRAWYRIGIPYKHWAAVKALAFSANVPGIDDAALAKMRPVQAAAA